MAIDKILKDIGTNLKKSRQKKGLTQHEVAKASGTDTNYYAKIERGEAAPSLRLFMRIVRALKTKSSDILPF